MKSVNTIVPLIFFSCLFVILSCSKEDSVVKKDFAFKKLDFNYSENDLEEEFNNEIAKLGRVLFYDKELSLNATVSCGSCHKQEFSFADNIAKSEGFLGGLTNRNTPNLINIKFNRGFFWDSRTFLFKEAVVEPIFNHQEMGMTPDGLIDRLSKLDYYDDLFNDAFGSSKITGLRIKTALAEFVGSILAVDSAFDRFLAREQSLSSAVRNGMRIFENNCNSCHSVVSTEEDGDRSSDNPYLGTASTTIRNHMVDIGLVLEGSLSSTIPDFVQFSLFPSSDPSLSTNQFIRIPTLRNITSTAPYMHDGRFQTLMEVIDHYNEDVIDRPTIDARLLDHNGRPQKLNLSDEDKENLIQFLETLTDSTIEQSEKYSDPFIL